MLNEEVYEVIKRDITTPIVNECLNLKQNDFNYKIMVGGFLSSIDYIADQLKFKFVTEEQKNDHKLLKSIIKDVSSFMDFLNEIIRRNSHLKLSHEQAFFYIQACCLGLFNDAQTLNNQSGNLLYKNAYILKVDGLLQTICEIRSNEIKSPFPRIEASYRAIKLWRFRKTLCSMTMNCNWEDLVIGKMILNINDQVYGVNFPNRKDILNCHYFGESRFQYSFFGYLGDLQEKAKEHCNDKFFLFGNFYIGKQNNLLDLFV